MAFYPWAPPAEMVPQSRRRRLWSFAAVSTAIAVVLTLVAIAAQPTTPLGGAGLKPVAATPTPAPILPSALADVGPAAATVRHPSDPLPTGSPVYGVGTPLPLVWPSANRATARVVALEGGGVDVALPEAGYEKVTGPVSVPWRDAIRTDAVVTQVSAAVGDRMGIGCASPGSGPHWLLLISAGGGWTVREGTGGSFGDLVDGGRTTVLKPLGAGNTLTAVCRRSVDGSAWDMWFAINGTAVSEVIQPAAPVYWSPMVGLCSCDGPSEAKYTNIMVSEVAPVGS